MCNLCPFVTVRNELDPARSLGLCLPVGRAPPRARPTSAMPRDTETCPSFNRGVMFVLQNVSVNTSIFTLIAIALDRYKAIMKPFGKRSTKRDAMVNTNKTFCFFVATLLKGSSYVPSTIPPAPCEVTDFASFESLIAQVISLLIREPTTLLKAEYPPTCSSATSSL